MPFKTLGNVVVTYNAVNITQYLNAASLESTVEAIDTTNLASTGMQSTPGMPSFSVPIGGMWDKALDDVLMPDVLNPPSTLRTLVVQIGPTGNRVTYTWTGSTTVGAFVSDYKMDATDVKAVPTWSGTLQCSGAPTRT